MNAINFFSHKMKIGLFLISLQLFLLNSCRPTSSDEKEFKLWYTHPAEMWVEALPLGNGRLGAMVFGDPVNEQIQLNENCYLECKLIKSTP